MICTNMDTNAALLEREAYFVLNELVMKLSKKNLKSVRIPKSNLIHLLGWVQKVRDELEQLLDDDEDIANLYLQWNYNRTLQIEALVIAGGPSGLAVTNKVCT